MGCGGESALPRDFLDAGSERLSGGQQPLCVLQADVPDMTHYRSVLISEQALQVFNRDMRGGGNRRSVQSGIT